MTGRLASPLPRKAAAPGPARSSASAPATAWAGLDGIAQARLEVGPSRDRFEAEADRVAASVVANRVAPQAAPAISPFDGGGAARKRAQREERRPIAEREGKSTDPTRDLTGLLQRKTEEGEASVEEDRTAQAKRSGPVETATPEELKGTAQTKRTGVLQRDEIDDDTVAETSLQAKRDGTAQREIAEGKAELEQEPPKEQAKKPPEGGGAQEPVQRDAPSGGAFAAPAGVERGIVAMRGGGEPLSGDVRSEMEPHFGRDLSGVRIHSGQRAGDLSQQINAHAFTLGQDIFFGHGQYDPGTDRGRELLAHELTHTIQQQGGSSQAQPSRIQRKETAKAAEISEAKIATDPVFPHEKGELRVEPGGSKIVRMAALPVPIFDGAWKGTGKGATPQTGKPPIPANGTGPWPYKGKTHRGAATARQLWLDRLGKSSGSVASAIAGMENVKSSQVERDGAKVAYLKSINPKGAGLNFLLIGTPTELAATPEVLLPIWDEKGSGALFDVDHIQELQLGGLDNFPNFWLLDQGSNRSSGSVIAREMKQDFYDLLHAAEAAKYFDAGPGGAVRPDWRLLKDEATNAGSPWRLEYRALREVKTTGTAAHWSETQIAKGDHLKQLVALDEGEIMARGLVYKLDPTHVEATIFALKTGRGGFFRKVNFHDPNDVVTTDKLVDGAAGKGEGVAGNQFYKGFAVQSKGFTLLSTPAPAGGEKTAHAVLGSQNLKENQVIGNIRGQPFPASGKIKAPELDIPIKWRSEFGFGGYADIGWINEKLARLSIVGASPVNIHEAGLNAQGELFANGEIEATKALFPGLKIPIFLRGNEIGISFPIPTDKLKFGPVKVTDAALEVGFGSHGLFLGGWADIKVDRVGSGRVKATANSRDTVIEGDFNFDMNFLKPASAKFTYHLATDSLKLELKASLKDKALPGIASGHVAGKFSREMIELQGKFDLAPPLQESSLELSYTEKEGLVIAANDIPLPIKLPGISDASLSARAAYNPDDGSWRLSGAGKARFNIAPATGDLAVAVDGRQITIIGNAGFSLANFSGALGVTASNAKLDKEGRPIPGQVGDKFNLTGKGSASAKLGVLTGTVGIELTQDQHILVDGELAAPPSMPVFGRIGNERELFHFRSPDFLIWGIKIAGYGIGISAFADARLTADYFVGPGTLENAKATVKADLQKPEETVVTGGVDFVVPAGAGLTLDIGGGLTATLAVAYVEGRAGIDARLGVKAEARAHFGVQWTPAQGLELSAVAKVKAQPQFDIGVNARVKAGLDLPWPLDIEKNWGPWRKQLGSFGPSLAIGATVPVAWSERKGLDFDPGKIVLTKPEINVMGFLKDSFLKLV